MHIDGWGRGRRTRRTLAALAPLAFLLLAMPRTARAHAHLLRSTPSAGARVSAPTEIRLWFTEAPELSLSSLRLTDSAGVPIPVSAAAEDSSGVMAVRFAIGGTLAPGLYRVRWTTAAMDGHPSSGQFTFRVEAAPRRAAPPAVPAPPAAATPPDSARIQTLDIADTVVVSPLDASFVGIRALSFVALLALIGAVAFVLAVAPAIRSTTGDDALTGAVAGGAAIAAAAYVVLAAIRLAMQSGMMRDGAMDAAHLDAMAMGTQWGVVWRLQLGAGIAALAGALLAMRRIRAGWPLAAAGCVGLAIGSALGGHAGTADRWRAASVTDDALHILAAASWLGSLLWLVVAGLAASRRTGEGHAARVARLVHAFSPVALASAAVVAVTGAISGWMRLGSVAMLLTSDYGHVLLVKLALVAVVLALGAYHWRRVRPVLGTDAASARLSRSASVELMVGGLVLVATAVLVGTPTPWR
jgi:copper transport protein